MFGYIVTEEGKSMPLLITVVTEVIQKCWWRGVGGVGVVGGGNKLLQYSKPIRELCESIVVGITQKKLENS